MIEHYLGAEAFRDGVRRYMERHREGNAVAADLWRALERGVGQRRRARGAGVDRAARLPARLAGARATARLARPAGALLRRSEGRGRAKRRQRWPVPLVVRLAGTAAATGRARWSTSGAARRRCRRATPPWSTATRTRAASTACCTTPATLRRAARAPRTAAQRRSSGWRSSATSGRWCARHARQRRELPRPRRRARRRARPRRARRRRGAARRARRAGRWSPAARSRRRFRAWIARALRPGARARSAGPRRTREPDDVRLRRAALLRLVGGVAEAPEVLAEARRRLDATSRDRDVARAEPGRPGGGARGARRRRGALRSLPRRGRRRRARRRSSAASCWPWRRSATPRRDRRDARRDRSRPRSRRRTSRSC